MKKKEEKKKKGKMNLRSLLFVYPSTDPLQPATPPPQSLRFQWNVNVRRQKTKKETHAGSRDGDLRLKQQVQMPDFFF